jgi:cyclic pyranopterin phosphate synthase
MDKPSHIDEKGLPGMVDVAPKKETTRIAVASGIVRLGNTLMAELAEQGYVNHKGPIIQTAIIAGTMAVKNTSNTIPLCHNIPISSIRISIETDKEGFIIKCRVKCTGKTGVEMEALHGVTISALTIYDMCKAMSHDILIADIVLESKTGGKSDYERKTS